MANEKSVAVLGAGLAGLAAATKLVENGHNVTVFEARHRPGGRVWSETIEAMGQQHVYEHGAEFVLGDYSTFREYCEKYDLELVDTGMSYYVRQPADRPNVTIESMAELGKRAAALAADPEFHAQDRSVADALNELGITGDVRDALESRIYISTAVRTDQVTAQHTLDHVASFNPGPSWRVGGGNQRVATAMADALGDRVRYGAIVEQVSQEQGSAKVTANGTTNEFDYVVVGLPYSIVADQTNPIVELPSNKLEALNYVTQGHAAKLHLPLRERPDTSAVMSVDDKFWTWTALAADGSVAPVLNCFVGELGFIQNMQLDEGAETFMNKVTKLRQDLTFGDGDAVLSTWHIDPFSRGAYSAHAPGFTSQHAETLAAPVGRIHFAGEYVDPEQTGLMEGALRTGERAATAINAAAERE